MKRRVKNQKCLAVKTWIKNQLWRWLVLVLPGHCHLVCTSNYNHSHAQINFHQFLLWQHLQNFDTKTNLSVHFFFQIDLSKESATAVILCAFGIHNIKEVSRSQLHSAMRLYCTGEERKNLSKCDKKDDLIIPLASLLLWEDIVGIKEDSEASIDNLCRDDIEKKKTF